MAATAQAERGRESLSITTWMQKLYGLGVLDSLVTIARENGGMLRTAEAKHILIGARVVTANPKNVPGRLYTMLKERSDLFEQIAPGTYRLIEKEKPLSHVIALFDAIEEWLTVNDGIDYGNLEDLVQTALGEVADAYAKLTMCDACLGAMKGKG